MVTQASFSAALLNPNFPPPDGLRLGEKSVAPRFSVYRNNVVAGLSNILSANFPAVVKLLGDEYFRSFAACYIREHPPKSPILMQYGQEMPSFIASFTPLARYPYLSDVAVLELALRASYNAADSQPVSTEVLAGMSEGDIAEARLILSPALRQIRSQWPIHQIWMANVRDGPTPNLLIDHGEDVLIVRKDFDSLPLRHQGGGYEFVAALQNNNSIAAANECANQADSSFDLSQMLGALLTANAVIELRRREEQ